MSNPTQIIPSKASESQKWIVWHKAMKSRYGKKEANILFIKAWEMRGGAGSKASTNELREYMSDNGVALDTTAIEDVVDTTSRGLDAMGDFFTMGKYLAIGLGVIVVGGLGMLVFNIARNPIKSAGAAVKYGTPVGRASMLTGK